MNSDHDHRFSSLCVVPEHPDRFIWTLLLLSLILSSSGCETSVGPERVAASGTVLVDGTLMSSGVIRFIPADTTGGPAVMTVVSGGVFAFSESDGPVVGHHRVEVEATGHQGFAIDDEAAFTAHVQKSGRSPLAKNPIPSVYNAASTLSVLVENRPSQTFQFDLRSTP